MNTSHSRPTHGSSTAISSFLTQVGSASPGSSRSNLCRSCDAHRPFCHAWIAGSTQQLPRSAPVPNSRRRLSTRSRPRSGSRRLHARRRRHHHPFPRGCQAPPPPSRRRHSGPVTTRVGNILTDKQLPTVSHIPPIYAIFESHAHVARICPTKKSRGALTLTCPQALSPTKRAALTG